MKQHHPGSLPGRTRAVLAHRDHLGGRVQRVANAPNTIDDQVAVIQVGHHPLGKCSGLANGNVYKQRRVGDGSPRTGYSHAEIAVERQSQAIANDRLVHRGHAFGQGYRRRVAHRVSRPEVVEPWASCPWPRRRSRADFRTPVGGRYLVHVSTISGPKLQLNPTLRYE